MNNATLTSLGFRLLRFTDVWYRYDINDILSIDYSLESGKTQLVSRVENEIVIATFDKIDLKSVVKCLSFGGSISTCVICDEEKQTHDVCIDCAAKIGGLKPRQ